MRASRRFLYWGVFFLALGGFAVLFDFRWVDQAAVLQTVQLWPVAVVALGVAIVIRRTRYSLAAWLTAATLAGLLVGGTVAAGPRVSLDCTSRDRPVLTSQRGGFGGPATVDVTASCGSLDVATEPGSAWRLEAADPGRATASVASSSNGLTIDAGTTGSFSLGSSGRTTWQLTLPTAPIDTVRLRLSAGDGTVRLAGAHLSELSITASATEVHVDLSATALARLAASVSVGGLSIRLADANLTGTLGVNVGQINVCVPSDVGLRVVRASELGVVRYEGFEQHASEWNSPGYEQAPFHVNLTVTPTLGGIDFNPIGGC